MVIPLAPANGEEIPGVAIAPIIVGLGIPAVKVDEELLLRHFRHRRRANQALVLAIHGLQLLTNDKRSQGVL